MKKIATLLLTVATFYASAQNIPNNDFENWNAGTISPQVPSYWKNLNDAAAYLNGEPSVTRVTDKVSGTYALNLKNVKVTHNGKDTLFGGNISNDISLSGNQLPGYLKGYIKYSLEPGDKAIVSFGYKTTGEDGHVTIHGLGIKTFEGVSTSYIPFKITTNGWYYPQKLSDTLQIFISTYDYWGKQIAYSEKSTITLDSLGFGGSIAAPVVTAGTQINNGDFTSWTEQNGLNTPAGWFVATPFQLSEAVSLTKSADGFNGTSALQLEIDPEGLPAALYTFFKPEAGAKFINGYAKFNLLQDDSVVAIVSKYSKSTGLDGLLLDSIIFTGAQDNYKPFSLNFGNKINSGDTLVLQIAAYNPAQFANFRLEAVSPSTFLLDEITVGATALGIEEESLSASNTTVSPNPSANGIFTVRSSKQLANLEVYNVYGSKVSAAVTSGADAVVNISDQPKGVYFIRQGNAAASFRIIY